jgi:Mn2+/Fe2+ NRAMP family transporter
MVDLIVSAVLLAGLLGALIVVAARGGAFRSEKKEEAPVEHWVDGQCCLCSDPVTSACRACGRPLCDAHKPWQAHLFCRVCEFHWNEGARRRAFLLTPLVLAVMLLLVGALGLVAAFTHTGSLAIILAPLLSAPFVYLGFERLMRRRFRAKERVPPASATRPRS